MLFKRNNKSKESEPVKNEEVSNKKVIDDTMADMITIRDPENNDTTFRAIQPIIFIDSVKKPALGVQQPYSSPLNAHTLININAMFDSGVQELSTSTLRALDANNRALIRLELINYIKQNTYINFCNLINNMGPKMSKIIKYINLAQTLNGHLFPYGVRNYANDGDYLIDDFIDRYIYADTSNFAASFIPEYAYGCSMEETETYTYYLVKQLSLAVYNIVAMSVNEAVTNAYTNVYIHDQQHLIDITKDAFNISNDMIKDIGEANLPMFMIQGINNTIMESVELLMENIIVPSIHEVLYALPQNAYFVFNGIDKLNRMDNAPILNKNTKEYKEAEEKRLAAKKNYNPTYYYDDEDYEC